MEKLKNIQVDKLAIIQKWKIDEMAICQQTNMQFNILANCQIVKLINRQVDKEENWQVE